MITARPIDRAAAMQDQVARGYTQRTKTKVLRGEKDHDELVQAFAKHRTDALEQAAEMVGRMVTYNNSWTPGEERLASRIISEIRALK